MAMSGRAALAAVVVLMACGALVSCTSAGTSSPSDYIGPADRTAQAAKAPSGEGAAAAGQQQATAEQNGPVEVTVSQAIIMSLENNRSLVVTKLNPRILRTAEEQQRAVFDPDLTAQLSFSRAKSNIPGVGKSRSQGVTAQAGVQEFLPTGTLLSLTGKTAYSQLSPNEKTDHASGVTLSANQSLLRGAGTEVNLVALRQASIDTLSSEYELRGFTEALVAQVEETYWNYSLALKQMDILNQSLALAEQQLSETQERIRVGKLAETEAVAAEAEVALRKQLLIGGRNALETTRLQLLRYLSPPGGGSFDREIVLKEEPSLVNLEPEALGKYIEQAMLMRPDLNQAKLQVNRGDLDVVKTKNGLLPKLDLFMTLGRTGYSDSLGGSATAGDGRAYSLTAGLSAEAPIGNRAARAAYTRANLSREQSMEAVNNLAQLVEVDVRNAYINITLAKEAVAATAASRKLQAEKLRTETEKFNVGKSTSLLVAQVQRDYLASQITEVQQIAAYLNAFVELYRLDGTLLVRRGISCPGAEAVKMAGEPSGKAVAPAGK